MDIIGKTVPHLQSAISSGFENVNAGIVETTRVDGVSGLESAFESFSDSRLPTAGDLNLMPVVAGVAEYPDPVQSLGSSDSDSSQEILRTLQDSKFRPEAELAEFTETMQKLSLPSGLGKSVSEALSEKPSFMTPKPGFSFVNEVFEGAGDSALPGESFSKYSTTLERPHYLDPGSPFIQGPLNPMNQLRGPVSEAETTLQRARKDGTLPAPNTNLVGSLNDQLYERGIIIVGGKTNGTYLQTIDDTIGQYQNDPQPQTFELLQAQLAVVQDMTSTAQNTNGLFQQFNSNLMSNSIGLIPPKKVRG